MNIYTTELSKHKQKADILAGKSRKLSMVRFLIAVAAVAVIYHQAFFNGYALSVLLILLFFFFFYIVRKHTHVNYLKDLANELVRINSDELAFLKEHKEPYEDGAEFMDNSHDYAFDLDFFGKHSLYHHLNRTSTQFGHHALADQLLTILPKKEIQDTQLAVKELAKKVEWRHQLLATAKLKKDNPESVEKLRAWIHQPLKSLPQLLIILSFLMPLATFITLVWYALEGGIWGNLSFLLAIVNIMLVATQFKKIKGEIIKSTEVDKIIRQYAAIIEIIEKENFSSQRVIDLKDRFLDNNLPVSRKIKKLSLLFSQMDHVQNVFAGPLLNGLFMYHLHVLRQLVQWKRENAEQLDKWLQTIGEIEALNSIANFSYNNPNFVFPEISNKYEIKFENLGHPLIPEQNRVGNEINFVDQRFIILTGSNMSGKSTFLRTLGVNMVLAGIGAPVCATKACVHPMPVLVSMRLSDSLTDGASYFLAEVKRLQMITEKLEHQQCFILLDEILRGTNSDDKRDGTLRVIENVIGKGAIGAIATHDLEVCKIEKDHPEILANMRFEVEIHKDELVFDYKLMPGVCQNKSATFLMRQRGII